MYSLPTGAKVTSPTTTYTITGVLGSGGFGITYSATCIMTVGTLRIKANVALKEHFIKADCQRDEATASVTYSEPARDRVELTRKDFIGEAKRLNSISGKSPNIVTVSEVFEANNTAYYAMEMIEGQSLRDFVDDRGALSENEMLSIMTPVVEAVAFLHRNRITHLDIKPQNIMIATDENGQLRPVLIDFGLSKHYDENGEATSTINAQGFSDGYAPIEQYTGITTFSPASDVYSLAATMVYCLTGQRLPAALEVTPEKLDAVLPAYISPKLRATLKKALAHYPADRYADAGALLDALTVESRNLNTPADESTVAYIPKKEVKAQTKPEKPQPEETPKKSAKWLKIALAILAVCLVGGAVAYFVSISSSGKASAPEEAIAQARQPKVYADDELFPIIQGDKMGFADKNGNIIIPAEYDWAFSFSDGLARVEKDEKTGFIDKSGKVVVPLQYANAESFSEGMAEVGKDGKCGFIDKSGRVVVPLQYDNAESFSDGMAKVGIGDYEKGKYGFIDKTGNVVIPLEYSGAGSFNAGLATVYKDGKNGVINKSGKVVIPFEKYDNISSFNEGLALVYKGGKGGVIDTSGKIVIPLEYDIFDMFHEGLAWVVKDGKSGLIDTSGKVVIPFEKYDDIGVFNDGLAPAMRDSTWGFIDKAGNVKIPFEYNSVGFFNEGLATVEKDGKCGVIDTSGNVIIRLEYDSIGQFSEGLAMVRKNGKWGYIDHFGNFKPFVD